MKKLTKLLALLLALAMVFSLAACGGSDDGKNTPSTPAESSAAPTESEAASEPASETEPVATEPPAREITLYVVDKTAGESVNIWAWGSAGNLDSDWPGRAMERKGVDMNGCPWYVVTVDAAQYGDGMVLSINGAPQTSDIAYADYALNNKLVISVDGADSLDWEIEDDVWPDPGKETEDGTLYTGLLTGEEILVPKSELGDVGDESILGKWYVAMSMEQLMALSGSEVDEETAELVTALLEGFSGIRMFLEFNEDGTARFYADPNSGAEMVETMMTNLPAVLAASMGMTLEELEETLAAQGMTMDELMEAVGEELDAEDFLASFEEMNYEVNFYYDGTKLFVSQDDDPKDEKDYLVVSVNGSSLVITDVVGVDMDEIGSNMPEMPWHFTKYNSDDPIVGKWFTYISVEMAMSMSGEELDEESAALMEQLLEGFDGFRLFLEFNDDGSAKMYMDPESGKEMVAVMLENLPPVLAESMGMTMEELEETLAAQGMTMDELIEAAAEELDTDSLAEAFTDASVEAEYLYENGKLYLNTAGSEVDKEDGYLVVNIIGSEMAFTEAVGADLDDLGDLPEMPWYFTRAN